MRPCRPNAGPVAFPAAFRLFYMPGHKRRALGFGFFGHVFSPWVCIAPIGRALGAPGAMARRQTGKLGETSGGTDFPVDAISARAWQRAQAARGGCKRITR